MKKVYTYLAGVIAMLLAASCNGDVDFGEQYKKTLYFVDSKNLLHAVDYAYGAEDNKLLFSVYCASSQPIDREVNVLLAVDVRALDSLNTQRRLENPLYEDKVLLPSFRYELPAAPTITIRPGARYGTLELPVTLDGIDADVAYALPLTIVSNDAGYDVNPALRSIVHEIVMINEYTGDYSGSSAEEAGSIRPVLPTMKAISANQVRVVVHDMEDNADYLATNYMLLTIHPNSTVSITPWESADVQELPGSFYDRVLQSFELHYRAAGKVITEKITNIDAPKIEQ
ncbi:MAG: DUF1735 domain-containing protein [Odoribacteraceae bacterium]|jgi:hypothetical protein|nr:DUF1735 domain-containing protein [Odoribacteraceae bacterium]